MHPRTIEYYRSTSVQMSRLRPSPRATRIEPRHHYLPQYLRFSMNTKELKESVHAAKMAEVQTWMENEVRVPIARNAFSQPPMKLRWVLTIKKDTGSARQG